MKRQKPIHFKVLWVVKLLGFDIRKIRNKDDIFEDLDKVDTDLPSMYAPFFYRTFFVSSQKDSRILIKKKSFDQN